MRGAKNIVRVECLTFPDQRAYQPLGVGRTMQEPADNGSGLQPSLGRPIPFFLRQWNQLDPL